MSETVGPQRPQHYLHLCVRLEACHYTQMATSSAPLKQPCLFVLLGHSVKSFFLFCIFMPKTYTRFGRSLAAARIERIWLLIGSQSKQIRFIIISFCKECCTLVWIKCLDTEFLNAFFLQKFPQLLCRERMWLWFKVGFFQHFLF